jgi:hypothetical protein
MKIETYTLPAYWASALVNGDRSGLEQQDEAEFKQAIACISTESDTLIEIKTIYYNG